MKFAFALRLFLTLCLAGCSNPGTGNNHASVDHPAGTNVCIVYVPYSQKAAAANAGANVSPTGIGGNLGGNISGSWGSIPYIGDCKDMAHTMKPVSVPSATKPETAPAEKKAKDKSVVSSTNAVTDKLVKDANKKDKTKDKKRAEVLQQAVPLYEAVAKYENLRPGPGNKIPISEALAALKNAAAIYATSSTPQLAMMQNQKLKSDVDFTATAPEMPALKKAPPIAASRDAILQKAKELQRTLATD